MKKNEEFDLEVAIERVQKKFLYEDVIERISGNRDTRAYDYDEYEEIGVDFDVNTDPSDDPAFQLVEEMLEWYEKKYGKLSKSEKDELRIEICYNYEIDMD